MCFLEQNYNEEIDVWGDTIEMDQLTDILGAAQMRETVTSLKR